MENREIFSSITTIPPVFLRLDGRAFHHLTESLSLRKPFDDFFNKAMVAVCTALVSESGLSPEFAFTFSDEISLYLTKLPFSGRVEKDRFGSCLLCIECPDDCTRLHRPGLVRLPDCTGYARVCDRLSDQPSG